MFGRVAVRFIVGAKNVSLCKNSMAVYLKGSINYIYTLKYKHIFCVESSMFTLKLEIIF